MPAVKINNSGESPSDVFVHEDNGPRSRGGPLVYAGDFIDLVRWSQGGSSHRAMKALHGMARANRGLYGEYDHIKVPAIDYHRGDALSGSPPRIILHQSKTDPKPLLSKSTSVAIANSANLSPEAIAFLRTSGASLVQVPYRTLLNNP